ncbi:MAG TPA: helix-turn-helix transcriptional regulator [Victivallales bacterium]|nr:helix-turn-helix transcriptional regulator [Victivallales bacterium]|tara:strand:- start:501 stop:791 length:291 start_codon:yes stop_codon:yes gene_type:complete
MFRPKFDDFKREALRNTKVRTEYEKLKVTHELRKNLIKMRMEAGLTLEDLASVMNTSRSNLSRLESIEYLKEHSPKLSTIKHYAEACGKHLKIEFV